MKYRILCHGQTVIKQLDGHCFLHTPCHANAELAWLKANGLQT